MSEDKKQFWVVLTIVFLGFLGISMPYLIFPPLFLNSSYPLLPADWGEASRALFLGVTLAVYPIGQFLGSPILGTLSDYHGRKKLLSLSLLLSALCYLLSGIAIAKQHLPLLIFSRFIAGFMEGNISIARAIATDLKTISKQRAFGKINAVTSIAFLIGPFIGGLLSDPKLFSKFTVATPFYLVCVLFFVLTLLSNSILRDQKRKAPEEAPSLWQQINFIKKLPILLANKQLKSLILASTLFTLAVDIFYEFGPVFLTIQWTLTPAQLIPYNAALCLGIAAGSAYLPALFSSQSSSRISTLSSIGGFALLLIGFILTTSVICMILLCALCGLAIGLALTILTVDISNSASEATQGEVMGVQQSLRVLGDGIICLFGGALLIFSSKLILILAIALSLCTMAYYRSRLRTVKEC